MGKILKITAFVLTTSMFFAGCAGAATEGDSAPGYPGGKTIQMICGAAAGGGTDTTARILTKYLPDYLGNAVVVNVKGAGGTVAARQVLAAAPDGYTLSYYNEGTDVNQISGIAEFGMEAFEAILIPATVEATVLSVSDWSTLEETVAWGRAHPGELSFGCEVGTYTEQVACAFFNAFDIEGQLVDVGPTNDQIAALAGGHVKMIVNPIGISRDYRETGEFKTIAFLTRERNPKFPDIPTLIERGAPDWFYLPRYYYIGFTKGTPDNIIRKFSDALEKVGQLEAFRNDLEAVELTPNFMNREKAWSYYETTHPIWVRYDQEVVAFKKKYGQ
jgi:tripartite-type tricarboxylate transporter receptor subunit TctC